MIEARGACCEDLPSVDLDFGIDARLKAGQLARIVVIGDGMCQWIKKEQPDGLDHVPPPRGHRHSR